MWEGERSSKCLSIRVTRRKDSERVVNPVVDRWRLRPAYKLFSGQHPALATPSPKLVTSPRYHLDVAVPTSDG